MPSDTIPSKCESHQTIADIKRTNLNSKSQLTTIISTEFTTSNLVNQRTNIIITRIYAFSNNLLDQNRTALQNILPNFNSIKNYKFISADELLQRPILNTYMKPISGCN